MTKTLHTPGPWYATNVDYPDLGTMQGDEEGTWTVSTTPDQAGWRHDGGFPGYGVSEANARLMACAPELFAALEEIAAPEFYYSSAQINDTVRALAYKARAALSKARGGD